MKTFQIPVPDIYNPTVVFHEIYSFHQPQQLHRTKLRKSQIVVTLSERKLQKNDEDKRQEEMCSSIRITGYGSLRRLGEYICSQNHRSRKLTKNMNKIMNFNEKQKAAKNLSKNLPKTKTKRKYHDFKLKAKTLPKNKHRVANI